MAISHFAFNFGFGRHCSDRVNNENINRTGTHQGFCNFQCLFTAVRLGNQQVVNIHTQCTGIGGVQCVLHVNEGHFAALLLGFGCNMESNSRFTGAFRTIQFYDSAPWNATDTESKIQCHRAGRDGIYLHRVCLSQTHNCTAAVSFENMGNSTFQCFLFVLFAFRHHHLSFILFQFLCHRGNSFLRAR